MKEHELRSNPDQNTLAQPTGQTGTKGTAAGFTSNMSAIDATFWRQPIFTPEVLGGSAHELEGDMPRRLKEGEKTGDFDFGSFADVADAIKEQAADEVVSCVAGRIDCLLGGGRPEPFRE